MVTVRLVPPGGLSPVSTDPSFRTTRWVTVSLFLKTTDCPPTAAGLGENDWLPFWPTMVIVATFDGGADAVGVAGFDDLPQLAAAMASAITAPITPLLIRVASMVGIRHRHGERGGKGPAAGDSSRFGAVLLADGSRMTYQPSRPLTDPVTAGGRLSSRLTANNPLFARSRARRRQGQHEQREHEIGRRDLIRDVARRRWETPW